MAPYELENLFNTPSRLRPGHLAALISGLLLLLLLACVIPAKADNCPMLPISDQTDSDDDGIGDPCDNCTELQNADQTDADADGFGNRCDGDLDNSGTVDFADLAVLKNLFFTTDTATDLDVSGSVDFSDLAILKSLFFSTPGPTGMIPNLDNSAPIADAGTGRVVSAGQVAHLDATGSSDPDDDALNYFWFLSAKPDESQAIISDPFSAATTFQADLAGSYIAELQVSDGTATSSASITINAENQWQLTVDPQGGTFDLPNGVTLSIGAGAVTETVTLTISALDCKELDTLFSEQDISTHDKRCTGGLLAEPSGLSFSVPITVRIPVAPLEAGELPVLIEADSSLQQFRLLPTDLVYFGDEQVIEATITHFSAVASAAARSRIEPAEALPCSQIPIDPCCEKRLRVRSSEGDTTGSQCDCQLVGQILEVKFLDCPGEPGQVITEFESSGNCPENLVGQITPWDPAIWACQDIDVEAQLTGVNEDGTLCELPLPVNWTVDTPEVAQLEDTGANSARVSGLTEGTALLSAQSLVSPQFSVNTTLSVVALDGTWIVHETGSETCSIADFSWVETDSIAGPIRLATRRCDTISIDTPIPGAAAIEGALRPTNDLTSPFSFSIADSSSATADCVIFFDSLGWDIVFGDSVCNPEDTELIECIPRSCSENQNVSGRVYSVEEADAVGDNDWLFKAAWTELRRDPNSGQIIRTEVSIRCEGDSALYFTKQ